MSDEPEVEVTGTPDETEAPSDSASADAPPAEPTVPLDPSSSPPEEPTTTSDPAAPVDAPSTEGGDVTVPADGAVGDGSTDDTAAIQAAMNASDGAVDAPSTDTAESPPVAGVVEVPPEPVAPPPPPPVGDGVGTIDAADEQARTDQAQREAAAFALSTNAPAPPPLASIADVPSAGISDQPSTGTNSIWVCVTEEGPRTTINGQECPMFAVEILPPQGKLIACPTCGATTVRRATDVEQGLPQTAVA